MIPRPRQIVIDKCAFQAIKLDAFCGFAATHVLIVPDVLCYECHTDFADCPPRTLADCERLIRHGGYYCANSAGFIREEADLLRPFPSLLVDSMITQRIRDGSSGWQEIDAECLYDRRAHAARKLLVDGMRTISEKLIARVPDALADIETLPMGAEERMAEFLSSAETEMHDFAVRAVPNERVRDSDRFCLSNDWISWQYFRLLCACAMDYACRAVAGGPVGERRAEHDYQDLEYVMLLCRADGIITRDKKLVEPLARAAFPEKDVFSSLEEVPESYRCDWGGG